MKWEYNLVRLEIAKNNTNEYKHIFNLIGESGWELVSTNMEIVDIYTYYVVAFFKRPLLDTKHQPSSNTSQTSTLNYKGVPSFTPSFSKYK